MESPFDLGEVLTSDTGSTLCSVLTQLDPPDETKTPVDGTLVAHAYDPDHSMSHTAVYVDRWRYLYNSEIKRMVVVVRTNSAVTLAPLPNRCKNLIIVFQNGFVPSIVDCLYDSFNPNRIELNVVAPHLASDDILEIVRTTHIQYADKPMLMDDMVAVTPRTSSNLYLYYEHGDTSSMTARTERGQMATPTKHPLVQAMAKVNAQEIVDQGIHRDYYQTPMTERDRRVRVDAVKRPTPSPIPMILQPASTRRRDNGVTPQKAAPAPAATPSTNRLSRRSRPARDVASPPPVPTRDIASPPPVPARDIASPPPVPARNIASLPQVPATPYTSGEKRTSRSTEDISPPAAPKKAFRSEWSRLQAM